MKSKSSQKTRQPYGKVTEAGQVPVAFQEIREIASGGRFSGDNVDRLSTIGSLIDSIIAVTCANPGCLSQMAENMEVKS